MAARATTQQAAVVAAIAPHNTFQQHESMQYFQDPQVQANSKRRYKQAVTNYKKQ